MNYIKDQEEQTQCCFSDECDNVATNRVLMFSKFNSVCDEHKQELEEWIAEQLT